MRVKLNNTDRKLTLSDHKDIVHDDASVKFKLRIFNKISKNPFVFWRYRAYKEYKDKISLAIKYEANGEPKKIYWGSGSRYMDFDDIIFASYGHIKRYDDIENGMEHELQFCIVSKQRVLNLQSLSKYVTKLWVKGLCDLIRISEEQSMVSYRRLLNTAMNHYIWANQKYESDMSYDSSDDEAHIKSHDNCKR